MQLDLGGIGKGYAADEALKELAKHGVTRALVAAGGDIAVSGPPPDAPAWKIGIQPLTDPDGNPTRYLLLKDAAVSTSGDTEQFVEINGTRYSHIVDPKTGLGLTNRLAVTVVARNGLTCDPLTKVIAVLGVDRGMPIIDAEDGAAALVMKKTEKGTQTWESKRFKDIPQK
jgi:thiamine biosynthesis lipoprotein